MFDLTAFFVWLSFLFGGLGTPQGTTTPPPGMTTAVTAIDQSARSAESSVEDDEDSVFEFWLFISNGF